MLVSCKCAKEQAMVRALALLLNGLVTSMGEMHYIDNPTTTKKKFGHLRSSSSGSF